MRTYSVFRWTAVVCVAFLPAVASAHHSFAATFETLVSTARRFGAAVRMQSIVERLELRWIWRVAVNVFRVEDFLGVCPVELDLAI